MRAEPEDENTRPPASIGASIDKPGKPAGVRSVATIAAGGAVPGAAGAAGGVGAATAGVATLVGVGVSTDELSDELPQPVASARTNPKHVFEFK